jgi:hypothetical protein
VRNRHRIRILGLGWYFTSGASLVPTSGRHYFTRSAAAGIFLLGAAPRSGGLPPTVARALLGKRFQRVLAHDLAQCVGVPLAAAEDRRCQGPESLAAPFFAVVAKQSV